jgi:hypothetical protein
MVVAEFHGRRAQVDHGVVPDQFLRAVGVEGRLEVSRSTRPVGEPVQGTPVAQHYRSVVAVACSLELSLHVVDRPLRSTLAFWV